jgi:hypothetical protein
MPGVEILLKAPTKERTTIALCIAQSPLQPVKEQLSSMIGSADGLPQAYQRFAELAQERFIKNTDALNRLTHCRSVQDFVAVQSEFVRDNLQQAADVAQVSLRAAEEAARTIEAQANKNTQRIRRAA